MLAACRLAVLSALLDVAGAGAQMGGGGVHGDP